MSVVVAVAGLWVVVRMIRSGSLGAWVLPVGAAGFVGNAVDRLAFGYVRDWMVVGPMRWNLADIFLLIAIVAVVVGGVRAINTDDRKEVMS